MRRFRVDVGTIICAVALVQSLLLVALGYWAVERLVSKVGSAAHKINHDRVEDNVLAFLAKTEAVMRSIGDSPSLHAAGEYGEQTAEMLWTLLEQTPELDSLNVATDDGHLVSAMRYPAPALRQVLRGPAFSTETWQYKRSPDSQGGDARQRFATTHIAAYRSDYDPTQRTWFVDALKAKGPTWTAPFLSAAAQELAISHALPAGRLDDEGRTQHMVVAANVSLGHLSKLVRVFGELGHGESALLSADHHVLARSDQPHVVRQLESPDTDDGVLGALHAHMLAAGTAGGTAGGVDDMAFSIEHQGRRYLVQTSHIPSTRWQLVSWESEDLLLGDLQRTVLWALLLTFAFLAVALFISLRLSKLVTRPIENLSRVARRIGRLELDNLPLEASRVLEIQHLNQALDESARSLKAFSKFVPVDIIKQLVAEGQALAPSGAPRRITAMFTDVEGFTSISESLDADVLVKQLTEYFNLAARIFARHGGVVDKYMGDGIMVLWGAPADLEDAEYRACVAALELHAEMNQLNASWRSQGLREFRTRIGIHTGLVIAGVLGSSDRLSYTAVGDVINVASRIEGANKDLGTRTLISETTFAALGGRVAARRIEEMIELRGRQTRMVLYELLEIEHQSR
ncbi:adenylate/guanylate cyclase domain-containing protein [Variovorax sp. J22G73]|uniref:adenylate/guanylate cyclase domain-containing protein n=1 Tax=unclassified Variovorax TaxID=663243 RepID=UPI000D5D919D|nr:MULTISPECIES: adenylate/guanylate cyclase domain-containing protein [unclassified Variovorax]MDM0006319.1 adenylate/guanylate cyclase domain-containing protein [Variovorax sp. J22R203]MDM0097658.1 adenylate/guanylate cyclase domain-containing protein [Variovorax sp. J22G73]